MNMLRRTLVVVTPALAVVLVAALSGPFPARADSVGQVQTTKFLSPETVTMLKDRAIAGHPGFLVGDTLSYIIQYTPIANGATTGLAGYITDYIPPGAEVIGASIVAKDGSGNYYDIAPSLPAGANYSSGSWGTRGENTFAAPFNTSAYDPTGLCAVGSPTSTTFTGSGNWTVPAGVTSATVEVWGGGGAGGGATTASGYKGGGGAGGQYASSVIVVTPSAVIPIVVGAGGTGSTGNGTAGGDSTFNGTVVVAKGGAGGIANGAAGAGSSAGGAGTTVYAGGSGSAGGATATGGAGGGGAGSGGNGGNASGNTAGTGTATGGGNGGAGRSTGGNGNTGSVYGGGGGGGYKTSGTNRNGGAGAAGQVVLTYNAPLTNNCNARLAELHADTGIFYSTDPRTVQFPALPTRILQGTNGYNINPTGAGNLNTLIGQASATTHNLWDADNTNAFGSTPAAIAALAAPKSSQTALLLTDVGQGATPFYSGSGVAGPETGYQFDNTAQVGPWQRINYPGSRMGDASLGPATAAPGSTAAVGGFSTNVGWNLSSTNPLPAGTNALRWATGKIVVGEIRYVKISLRLTEPIPTGGLINGSEVFGGDAGDGGKGKDNVWRYHVPSVADNNSNLFVLKEVIGYNCLTVSPYTCTAGSGSYISANSKVRYQITYLNAGNAAQTNLALSDMLPCQTGAAPVSYNGVANTVSIVSGPIASPSVATLAAIPAGTNGTSCTAADRRTFNFPTLAALGPGEGGTIVFDVQTNAALGSTVPNTATLASTQVTPGVSSTANSYVANAPNLSITKTTSTPTVAGGGTATYTITVTNNGTAAASSINVYDMLPTTGGAANAATRFNYSSTTSSVCGGVPVSPTVTTSVPPTLAPYDTGGVSANQQQVLWNFGATTLAVGASCTITFNAGVGASVPASVIPYKSNVIVGYNTSLRSDAINVAPVTVTSTLSLTKTITHWYNTSTASWVAYTNFIPANAKVRYQLDYSTSTAATGANITDTLPCQTAANSVSNIVIVSGPIGLPATNPPTLAAGNCSTSTRQSFSFTAANLTASQSGQITFEVQTNAANGNVVVNTATLSGTGVTTVTSEVQTTVRTAPTLTIGKTASVSGAKVNQTVSYTLTVTNSGTADATRISIHDWLPSGGAALNAATRFSFVNGSSTFGGSITGVTPTVTIPPTKANYNSNVNAANMQELVWNFGAGQTLVPGASFSITFDATIGGSVPNGSYSNNARAYFADTTLTGTVSATNGSTTVTGAGTSFNTQLSVGRVISIAGVYYTVAAIASATSLTLTTAYTGATAGGLTATKSSQVDANSATISISTKIADIAVTKTNNSSIVPFGGTTTYTITVTNNGPDEAAYPNSGAISITFASAAKTITRSAGSFIADGFVVGNKIITDAALNPGPFTVIGVTATVLTVYEAVVNEGPVSKTVIAPTIVFDAVAAGLSKTGVTCVATGGAVCPTTLTVARLEGSGLAIPAFPSGGVITLTVPANVTGALGSFVTNRVTALPPLGVSEGNWSNNTASDTDPVQVPVVSVDHYELSLPTGSVTCLATTATVTACADATSPCTNPAATVNGTTATLAASAGTLAPTTVTFNASGVAGATLSYPTAGDGTGVTVTLSGEQTAAANPRKCCPNGVSCVVANSCTTTFNTTGFIFSDSAGGGLATIPTQEAGTTSGTFYLRAVRTDNNTKACVAALSGGNSVQFGYECNNPLTCSASDLMSMNGGGGPTTIARNDNSSVSSFTSVSLAFDGDGNAPFTFNYSDVGLVTLHARKLAGGSLLSALIGSSNAFVVRPGGFVLSDIKRTADNFANPGALDATGGAFVRAGADFTVTVTATTTPASGGLTTPNYGRETTPETVKLTSAAVTGLGLANDPALINPTAFGSFANGVATGTTFNWGEVGIITLSPSVGDANYLGVGDVTGTTSGNIGRFYPDHFAFSSGSIATRTDISPVCFPASDFTYMDEPFQAGFTLTAQSLGNAQLQNYTTANNFAKLATGTPIPSGFGFAYLDGTTNLTTRVDSSLGITSTPIAGWTAGVLNATATLRFTRNATPDGPYNAMKVGIAPVDSDGVTLNAFDMNVTPPAANEHAQVGPTTQIRFGRLRLQNAYGSELLPLPIPMTVQYWNGTAFVTNNLDSCTPLLAGNIGMVNNLSGGGTTTATVGAAFNAGVGSLTLSAPGAGKTGSVDLAINLGSTANAAACPALTPPATAASLNYLQGFWCGTGYNRDPAARATFGVYSNPSQFIYLREMY